MVIFVLKNKMLIYNTTYHLEEKDENNFVIWVKESYIPKVLELKMLMNPRFCKVLSHKDDGVSFSLQWEVESSEILHRWYREQGNQMSVELTSVFKDRLVGFSTILEIVE